MLFRSDHPLPLVDSVDVRNIPLPRSPNPDVTEYEAIVLGRLLVMYNVLNVRLPTLVRPD